MNVGYKKRFLRDLENLPESVKQRVQEIAFNELPEVKNIQQIVGLKKLKGYSTYYRLRYSDYRLGISINQDKIVFHRVLHRKDIYRYFP